MDSGFLEKLLDTQQVVIEQIASNTPLPQLLEELCLNLEKISIRSGAKTSVLLLEDECLYTIAAPSLPQEYLNLIEGIKIGPKVGSCGTASFLKKQVIVSDILNDPLWEDFQEIAKRFNLKSCWSTPIYSSNDEVMGTFAIYYDEICEPTALDLKALERFTALCSVAVEKSRAEAKIERLAFYDSVTGLPNRSFLEARLDKKAQLAIANKTIGALLYLNIDNFKRINESLGHSTADRLLKDIAGRLQSHLPVAGLITRFSGDEFIILLDKRLSNSEAMREYAAGIAIRIVECFEEKFEINERQFKVATSIGIALFDQNTNDQEEILRNAHCAMFAAKSRLGSTYNFYDPVKQQSVDENFTLEFELLNAISQSQIDAHFQVQVNSKGTIIGAEALARWHHPEKGFIPPNVFISAAEGSDTIFAIQDKIVHSSCRLMQKLHSTALLSENFTLSINISVRLLGRNLLNELLNIIHQYNCQPNQFMLEITESMLLGDDEANIRELQQLKDAGFKISLDDFGTGYSSLAYLHTFPINEIKIDKCFIDKLPHHSASRGVVEAVISLARSFNCEVIAEGVESFEQKHFLWEKGVSIYQGYLFSKPVPEDEFIKLAERYFLGKEKQRQLAQS